MANGYTPSFTGPFALSLPSNAEANSPPLSGHGSPERAVHGIPGWRYVDVDTNDLYMKFSGTGTRGWQHIGQYVPLPGSGAVSVYSTEVDPNGVVEATGAAFCAGSGAMAGKIWVKTTAGTSNSEWNLLIG